ncbi:MAG: IS1595 family transposase [Caulobacteraceae bacterium]|nr:IS1595 family transposase [Caulobacteraceae bacterium]
MSVLSQPRFHNEAAAFEYVERLLWPNGPICPHCGGFENIYDLSKTRIGLRKCGQCRKQFTVRVGTILEDSHLPMTKWLQAIHLMVSSKKGVSSHQLHRTLECTYKTAWFLTHRIREAMREGELAPFGGTGGDVEVDETFISRDPDAPPTSTGNPSTGFHHKMKVLTLVDRTSGRARSFVVDTLSAKDIAPILSANIAKEARLLTDEARRYIKMGRQFADHQSVNHGKEEYVSRTDPTVHTNTVEGFYSIFKRGMRGVYQHASKKHLHRYMAEFDFRYSHRVALGVDDQERASRALAGVVGKRLRYDGPSPSISV